ncbi:MAG: methylenetetrahydrofolate reductase [NAD(P)H] [Bacteroidales bacterium]|nr:methylenetetrahydrofolate reductase [NAD(P)H] [Bacteroidales bacterium]
MKIKDILSSQQKPFASLEIVPPLKGVSKKDLIDSIRPFMEFNPPFINVTCHRDEFEFRPEADGTFSRHLVRRRVSETAVCAAIQAAFPVEVVPHLICGGASSEMIDSQLNDFKFLGIENIMALRGDSLLGEKRFIPEPGGYRYAGELVAAVRAFERSNGAQFCIGVGAYPEKHFEAPNLETDIANLKKKVDAGADYIITQMFFDNDVFYRFRDKCRASGINVPIIPGLKPLSTFKQIEMLPEAFSLDIPQDLVAEFNAHPSDRTACYQAGIEWCSAQCKDLLKNGVPAIHFYTMGRPDNVVEILKKFF